MSEEVLAPFFFCLFDRFIVCLLLNQRNKMFNLDTQREAGANEKEEEEEDEEKV